MKHNVPCRPGVHKYWQIVANSKLLRAKCSIAPRLRLSDGVVYGFRGQRAYSKCELLLVVELASLLLFAHSSRPRVACLLTDEE